MNQLQLLIVEGLAPRHNCVVLTPIAVTNTGIAVGGDENRARIRPRGGEIEEGGAIGPPSGRWAEGRLVERST